MTRPFDCLYIPDDGKIYDIFEKTYSNPELEPTVVLNAVFKPFAASHPLWDIKLQVGAGFTLFKYQT